jgi:hypothetical protein
MAQSTHGHGHHEPSIDDMFQAETGLDEDEDDDDGDGKSTPASMLSAVSKADPRNTRWDIVETYAGAGRPTWRIHICG